MQDATNLKSDLITVDDQTMRRAKCKKMLISENGMHCLLLADHELFYNHFSSEKVEKVKVDDSSSDIGRRTFRSIDILRFGEANSNVYEVLIGSDDGYLILGAVEFNPRNGSCEVLNPFKSVAETPEYSPLLDIKITKVKNEFLTLAVSSTSLY